MKAQVYKLQTWVNETNPEILRRTILRILNKHRFEILNFVEHHFDPIGYTCIWLIGESHLAIHTFPEEGKTYIDLTSCNEHKFNLFKQDFNIK